MGYFSIMIGGIYALLFPLLVTFLAQFKLLDEWSNTYFSHTRTRVSPGANFAVKVSGAALLTAAVYALAMAVAFVWAHLTYTDHGYGVPVTRAVESASTWTQLYGVSPVLYPVAYSLWVALVAATMAIFAVMLSAIISNKFLASVAPFIIFFGSGFVLAIFRLESYSLPPFRFNLVQLPIWTEIVPWSGMVVVCIFLYVYIHRHDYRTPGIERG